MLKPREALALTLAEQEARKSREDVLAAIAGRAVASLHRPVPTSLGVDACEHCTALHGDRGIVRWPCPTWTTATEAAEKFSDLFPV